VGLVGVVRNAAALVLGFEDEIGDLLATTYTNWYFSFRVVFTIRHHLNTIN